jgi:hypothetical protein
MLQLIESGGIAHGGRWQKGWLVGLGRWGICGGGGGVRRHRPGVDDDVRW